MQEQTQIKIDEAVLIDAVERSMFGTDNPGFCLACGAETDGVEPDAEKYPCDCCDKRAVYGAEQIMLMQVG